MCAWYLAGNVPAQGSADLAGGLGGLNLGGTPHAPQRQQAQDDFFGLSSSGSAASTPTAAGPPLPLLLPGDKGKGLTISGRIVREHDQLGACLLNDTHCSKFSLFNPPSEEQSTSQMHVVFTRQAA